MIHQMYRSAQKRGREDVECEVIIMSTLSLTGLNWTLLQDDAIPSEIRALCGVLGDAFLSERYLYKAPTVPRAQELYTRYGPFENELLMKPEFDRLLTAVEEEYVSQARLAGNPCDFDPTGNWMPLLERGAGFVSKDIGDNRIMMGLVPKSSSGAE